MQNQNPPREVAYRWVILSAYLLASLANSIPVNTFSGINSTVEKLFNISAVQVTLNTLLFPIAHTLFAFPCNWLITTYGVRPSYYLGGGLVVAGVWLRMLLLDGNGYFCLLGSLVSAVGGIFILNTSSKIAFGWFRSEQVPLITFLCVMGNLLSMAVGLALPGMVIHSNSQQEDVLAFLRLEALMVSIPMILLMIVIREKPPVPPSASAAAAALVVREPYLQILRKLFSNKNYLKLALGMAFNYGITTSFFSILEQSLRGLGYAEPGKTISTTAVAGTVMGICGNLIISQVLRRTKSFKYTAAAINFGTFAGYTMLVLGYFNHAEATTSVALLSMIFGFCYFSVPSTFVLFASETAFPIDQGSVTGYLFAICQTFGFVCGLIFAEMLDKTERMSHIVMGAVGGILLLSFLMVLFTKEDLKKTRFELGLKKDEEDREDKLKESLVSVDSIDG